jgi:hypothetical protein
LIPRIDNALEKINEYYIKLESSPYYAMALILQPGRRTAGLKKEWGDDRAKISIHYAIKLWERYRDHVLPVSLLTASSSYELDQPLHQLQAQETKEKAKDETVFEKIKREREYVSRPKSEDEFEDYCNKASYNP